MVITSSRAVERVRALAHTFDSYAVTVTKTRDTPTRRAR